MQFMCIKVAAQVHHTALLQSFDKKKATNTLNASFFFEDVLADNEQVQRLVFRIQLSWTMRRWQSFKKPFPRGTGWTEDTLMKKSPWASRVDKRLPWSLWQ